MNWIAVFIGGGLGSILRFGLSRVSANWTKNFPMGTLVSNVLATLILALVIYGFARNIKTDSNLYLFLAVGLCGGFSTFSTFSLETFRLFDQGLPVLAFLNIVLNVVICIGLVWVLRLSSAP